MAIANWCNATQLAYPTDPSAPAAAELASRILYSLTGRVYSGVQSITETYLPPVQSQDPLVTYTLAQYGIGTISRMSPMRIGLNGDMRIPLRRRPVQSVTSVVSAQDGSTIASGNYVLASQGYLTVKPTVPVMVGLTVTYTFGRTPPPDGVDAAIALANELVVLMSNIEHGIDTRLKNVTNFTRNGVNFQIEDARTIFVDGRTGIPEVDMFVASVNPMRSKRASRVLSPDQHFIR